MIGGTFRGRRLAAVPGRSTRPTPERVREALFSRLESRYGLEEARVLDLFAGTAALGIEALSRGAAFVACVESDRAALRVLRSNLSTLGLDARARVLPEDFRRALSRLEEAGERFDGVLVDAPYGRGLTEQALQSLTGGRLLGNGAWVAVETSSDEETQERNGCLCKVREDRYGDTKLTVYEWEELC